MALHNRRTPRPLTLLAAAGVVLLVLLAWRHKNAKLAHGAEELAQAKATLAQAQDTRVAAAALKTSALPLAVSLLNTQETDLLMRSLGGKPELDAPQTQRFMLCLTVGVKQKDIVAKIVSRFNLRDFVVMLFHYDAYVDAWSDMPWHDAVLHVSAKAQSKWWFAKRFLHPAVVGAYDLLFVWDEDIGVDKFDPSRFVELVQSNALAIAQPAIGHGPVSWPVTRRVPGSVLHRCNDNGLAVAPCVEVMVPVFTAEAWSCVWSLLPNDLVHAFGVDLAWHVCAGGGGTSSMAVVDEQSVDHLAVPSLGEQGPNATREQGPNTMRKQAPWESVHARRTEEWRIWNARWEAARRQATAEGR